MKKWRIYPHDSERIAALQRTAGIPAVLAQLLVCRGMQDPEKIKKFLTCGLNDLHGPELLPGAMDAAERIMAAIAAGRKIVVYGDYDVDGMSGTAILYLCLKLLSADVSMHLPHRIDEGYGLHSDTLRTLGERGAQLIVTVDCGIASVAEAQTARELGLELIITDHHQPPAVLPDAAAIVHPALPGTSYPFTGLCGAGVAFKLAWLLCQQASQAKKVGERMQHFLLQAVGLAALGTVADVVPLVDENRILVRDGLVRLKQMPMPGLAAIFKVAKLDEKLALGSEDIAFAIAPLLNAAGRLKQAVLGTELLTTSSPERAAALAEYLKELNGQRDHLERSVYLAANKQALESFDPEGDSALVLADRGWHPGVIGIVAGRLAEKFHRPVVMIAIDELGLKPCVGSARSVPGFDLHAALEACTETLVSHGGHAAAAGLKIQEPQLDAFRAAFCEHASSEIRATGRVAELRIDAEVFFSSLTVQVIEQLERLAPFGQGNPRPMLCASNVKLVDAPKRMGGGDRHLSLRLVQHGAALRGVAFGGGDWAEPLAAVDGEIAVAFRPVINNFKSRKTVELHICDWQPANAPDADHRLAPAMPELR